MHVIKNTETIKKNLLGNSGVTFEIGFLIKILVKENIYKFDKFLLQNDAPQKNKIKLLPTQAVTLICFTITSHNVLVCRSASG